MLDIAEFPPRHKPPDSALPRIACAHCGSDRLWLNGLRAETFGETVTVGRSGAVTCAESHCYPRTTIRFRCIDCQQKTVIVLYEHASGGVDLEFRPEQGDDEIGGSDL